jgi:hypothetical protein
MPVEADDFFSGSRVVIRQGGAALADAPDLVA